MSVIGARIKKEREAIGITQLQLAEKLDINNSVISRIEAGKRNVEDAELIKFADFFDVDGDYLLGRTDIRNRSKNIDGMFFYGGPDKYTPDEIAEMDAALKRYREMKKRAAKEAEKHNNQ